MIFRNSAGRIFAVIFLSSMFLYQTVVITGAFQDEAENAVSGEKPLPGERGGRVGILPDPKRKYAARVVPIRFNPSVPDEVPDLSSGYIFREERSLNQNQAAVKTFDPIDIDELYYSGSVISDEEKIALVVYQKERATPRIPLAAGRRPNSRYGDYEKQKLRLHDTIGGYTVAGILPEKLILTREEQSIEKYLYDPAKPPTHTPPKISPKLPGKRHIGGRRHGGYPVRGRGGRPGK